MARVTARDLPPVPFGASASLQARGAKRPLQMIGSSDVGYSLLPRSCRCRFALLRPRLQAPSYDRRASEHSIETSLYYVVRLLVVYGFLYGIVCRLWSAPPAFTVWFGGGVLPPPLSDAGRPALGHAVHVFVDCLMLLFGKFVAAGRPLYATWGDGQYADTACKSCFWSQLHA